MAKKSRVTQELANAFPDWSKVRNDDQSVGKSLLNVLAHNIQTVNEELFRGRDNTYLTTANVNEIDLTYTLDLPPAFEFDVQDTNTIEAIPLSPTVSGEHNGSWYTVSGIDSGKLRDFWYEAIPDRLTEDATYTGVSTVLLSDNSNTYSWSGFNDIFLPNQLSIIVESGVSMFTDGEDIEDIEYAHIRITGTTWKGTVEEEEINFFYNRFVRTTKAWEEIDRIQALDFPSTADIQIQTHSFNMWDYPDVFGNMSQFEHSRDNLPHFWSIEDSCWTDGLKLLTNKTYVSTTSIDVLRNLTDKQIFREWELLDENNNTIEPLDLALIPYQHRAWVVTASGLYLYDLDWELPTMSDLNSRDVSPLCQIVSEYDYVTRGQTSEILLKYVRPTKTVKQHRLRIRYPDGVSYGVQADGSLVSTSTSYWVGADKEQRFLRAPLQFEFTDPGEHLLTLEVEYEDGVIETDKRIVICSVKRPLAQFNLTDFFSTTAQGIDVDHQQRVLVLDTASGVHHLEPHYDVMLIDFNNKQLIFREPYTNVKVIK